MSKIIEGKFREPQSCDPVTATCGRCEDEHVTTRYMAGIYSKRECSLCIYEDKLNELYEGIESKHRQILQTIEGMKKAIEQRKNKQKEYYPI